MLDRSFDWISGHQNEISQGATLEAESSFFNTPIVVSRTAAAAQPDLPGLLASCRVRVLTSPCR